MNVAWCLKSFLRHRYSKKLMFVDVSVFFLCPKKSFGGQLSHDSDNV